MPNNWLYLLLQFCCNTLTLHVFKYLTEGISISKRSYIH
nr:MAG TPA: hypothetical protein [Crassvirales sp.]